MPSLENLHQHFKDKNFTLLAVDVGEKAEIVQQFVHDRGLSFRFLLDEDGRVSAQYGVRSHPMKFLIDKNGNLIGIAYGYREWDTEEMKSLIQLLINSV
ncbi:TlpA family protein disulfide reductase [bacterium]|nr:MAG: TlpA family protein disulfide reductase [bacterium]